MRDGKVLLVTDVRNDFCPGGRLAERRSSRAHGFDTIVIEEACRAIDLAGTAAQTKASFRDRGIKLR